MGQLKNHKLFYERKMKLITTLLGYMRHRMSHVARVSVSQRARCFRNNVLAIIISIHRSNFGTLFNLETFHNSNTIISFQFAI